MVIVVKMIFFPVKFFKNVPTHYVESCVCQKISDKMQRIFVVVVVVDVVVVC